MSDLKAYEAPKAKKPTLVPFSSIPVGQFFWFQGELWKRVEAEGYWNAKAGERQGQFEDDELVG